MLIIDTDHLSVLHYEEHPRCASLVARLEAATEVVVTTVICWEEQVRGWLAEIKRAKKFLDEPPSYDRLLHLVQFFAKWEVLPFTKECAEKCEELRKQRIRIGSQDLKIAAIALINDGLLLSANLRDFRKVPGLRVESWID